MMTTNDADRENSIDQKKKDFHTHEYSEFSSNQRRIKNKLEPIRKTIEEDIIKGGIS